MMNITTDHMDDRLKWCQSYKNQNWDLIIFRYETVLVTFEKVKRSGSRKAQFIELQKLAKESIRSMCGQQYQEQKQPNLNYLLIKKTLMLISKFKKNKFLKKMGSKN